MMVAVMRPPGCQLPSNFIEEEEHGSICPQRNSASERLQRVELPLKGF